MDEILASTLSRAVFGRLEYLDNLVYAADQSSLSSLADTEIVRLTETVREMLAQHQPDANGHCPQCSGVVPASSSSVLGVDDRPSVPDRLLRDLERARSTHSGRRPSECGHAGFSAAGRHRHNVNT